MFTKKPSLLTNCLLTDIIKVMDRDHFSAYEAAVEFYNLFFGVGKKLTLRDYLDNSFCDQIIEIDLSTGCFKLLYGVENKYFAPVTTGSYKNMTLFLSKSIIHPEDRSIFLDLVDISDNAKKLREAEHPNFRFNHFRTKTQDGSFRWVELVIISGKEYGLPENIIKTYLFDIHNAKIRELGQSNDEKLLFSQKRDKVTGLLSSHYFYDEAKTVSEQKGINWCAICIDIEHFKLFDDWYGRESGDYLLTQIGSILSNFTKTNGGVAGYFGQDDFVLLSVFDLDLINGLYEEIKNAISEYGFFAGFMPAIGVCDLSHVKSIVDAFDKASVAEYIAKKDVKNRVVVYDEKISIKQEKEYHLFLEFMEALKNGEISFYLQPQIRFSTKKIVGAEALSRWIKKDGTSISPVVFIPILEKFSFITDLDMYIWDGVCQWLRKWIDEGHTPVPISVNVSRVDIFTINIAEHFKSLIEKYKLDPALLKIEITESAYAETTDEVGKLVSELRSMGFYVLMDDFGSGYSSLNMLRNLKVDAIKLDALFLNIEESDYQKGINILESVINMAKTISLPMIVEGIETKEQADFLINLGCRYAQGYYYYKPIPVNQFEEMISDEKKIDLLGIVSKSNDELKIREFLDENIYSDTMLNSILGPVAFYSWKDKRIDIVRYNQKFYESVGAPDFNERIEHVENSTYKEDLPLFYELLDKAMKDHANGSSGIIRFHRVDNSLLTYLMRFYYIGEKEGTHRFYGSVNNITELMDLQQKMSLIAQFSSDTIIFLTRKNGHLTFDVACHGLAEKTGLSLEQLSKEFETRTIHKRIVDGEREEFKAIIGKVYEDMSPFSYTFHYVGPNGQKALINAKADPVSDRANNVEYIMTFRYIDQE